MIVQPGFERNLANPKMILLLVSTLLLASLLFLMFPLDQQTKFIIFVLKFVSTIFDLITLPVYLLIDQPWKIKLRSKTLAAERHNEVNNNYCYWETKKSSKEEKLSEEDRALRSSLGMLTHLSELLSIAEKLHKGKKCLGRRKILKKKWEDGELKFELGDEFEWTSYDEVLATIRKFGKILRHKFQLGRGDRVAIFAETSPEYFIMFFALQSLGCEVIALRSTPDEKTIPFTLNLNEVQLVFTQTNFVGLLNKLKPNIATVTKLIAFRHPFGSETDEEEIQNVKYDFFEYDQLLKEAQDQPSLDFKNSFQFSSNDIATVMNTSGSSGLPKSVLMTHANWAAFLKGIKVKSNNENTFLAFVEGSHVGELTREVIYFACGTKIAFGTEDTFLTGSPLLAKGCIGDLEASEATNILAFPPYLEHFRSLIDKSIRSRSSYLAAVYDFAYEYKRKWTKRRFPCRLIDTLLFKSLKNGFSKRLESIFTGGTPLNIETGIFLKLHLNIKLSLAYGATETLLTAVTTTDQFDHTDTSTLVDGVKLRLDSWQEGGYRVDDRPNPRGEIIIGSDMVSAGYYKNEKETIETFFEDGGTRWWKTGDIGEINEYGQLSIIDRKNNFIKINSGDFISLGKVESVLHGCSLVDNIAVHANSYFEFTTAIVVPNEENICKLAKALGKCTDDPIKLYKDEDLEKAVAEELARFGTENGLISIELPAVVKLVTEKWTAENGLVTETKKLKRKAIYLFYKDLIDSMYKS